MKRLFVLAPLALAACHAKPVALQAGHWDMTMTFKDIQAPGAPPESLTVARQMMGGKPINAARCVSAAEASQPNAGFFGSDSGSDNCTNERFTMADGKIDISMTCRPRSGPAQHRTVAGTYTPDSMDATATISGQRPGMNGDVTITMAMTGKHNGECNGHEEH